MDQGTKSGLSSLEAKPENITPQMVERGSQELLCFDWSEMDSREAARRVFQAMIEACHNASSEK